MSLAASLTPACIIPVGPEWHDPLGVGNSPPRIFDPNYEFGAEFGAVENMPPTFEFSFTDINAGDTLRVGLFADERQLSIDERVNGSGPGGTPVRHRFVRQIGCPSFDRELTRHPITVAVADRKFTGANSTKPLEVEENGQVAVITWTLNMICKQ